MTDYQELLYERVTEIYRFLDEGSASSQEAAEVFLKLLNEISLNYYDEHYFFGILYPTKVDILTGLRAEKLEQYLKKKPWMTRSDVAKICLSLQRYVDEKPREKEEYERFLEWLATGPVDGEHNHFWYERFFERDKAMRWITEDDRFIEVDERYDIFR